MSEYFPKPKSSGENVKVELDLSRDLKVDGCQSNFGYYVKTIIFFINFTTSFVDGILWWTNHVVIIYSNLCNTTTFES